MRLARPSAVALLLGCLATPAPAADPPQFPLKDGDVWVMAGDSITAQHLHSNYFEAFCFARYPKLKFAFRNSGVGGHTIPSTLARFDYDVAAWKPTVVSVELGMNDSGGTPTDKFVENMGVMVDRIRKVGARPVILAASPVNDGTIMAKAAGRNVRLGEYATALKAFSEKEKIPYADQFHALVDVWGRNKGRETVAALKPLAADDTLAGVEHLRAFLAAHEKNPVPAVGLQGDPVHPGAPGQLMMAASLLKGLGADPFVSSAEIDAAAADPAAAVKATGCEVTGVKIGKGSVAFDRLDARLPFPIPDNARAVLAIAPDVLALSQYTLKVANLPAGDFAVKVNGVPCGRFPAKQLADGVNLTTLAAEPMAKGVSPIQAQMQAVLKAVDAKESIVGAWRGLSQKAHAKDADPKLKEDLAQLTKKVEAMDAAIRDAAKPQKLQFEITAVPAK